MDKKQEHELIRRAQQGDERAFEAIYNAYYEPLRIKALQFVCKEEAEDRVQDTFIKIYENLQRFDFNYRLSTWSNKILINNCLNFVRDKNRTGRHYSYNGLEYGDYDFSDRDVCSKRIEAALGSSLEQKTFDSPDKQVQLEEARIKLNRVLSKISRKRREVLELKYFKGLTDREIALSLGISYSTVKTRMYNGIGALRRYSRGLSS